MMSADAIGEARTELLAGVAPAELEQLAAGAEPVRVATPGKCNKSLRLVGVVAFLAALAAIGKVTGATEHLTVEDLRGWMADAGAWGVLLFVVAFVVGELIQVPGLIFVAAAVLSYGRFEGGVLSHLTASLSVCFSFGVVRLMGGKALAEIERPWVRKVMEKLDGHPISTVAILRVALVMSPPLNYALAPYRGLFPSPPLFDRMPTYRTQGKRSLNFLSAEAPVREFLRYLTLLLETEPKFPCLSTAVSANSL